MGKTDINRRDFIKGAAAVSAFSIVPSTVLGGNENPAPSEKLNIAVIGLRQGYNTLRVAAETENIVAVCDIDNDTRPEIAEEFPNAKRYRDYRVMLEKQKDIDAVVIATPDHTHAVIAMACMQLGKHIYLEKP